MSSPSEVGRLTGLALDAMRSTGPSPLLLRVEMEARLAGLHLTSPAELLLEELSGPVGDNALAARLRTELAQWDADGVSDWAVGTSPKTDERRTRAYSSPGTRSHATIGPRTTGSTTATTCSPRTGPLKPLQTFRSRRTA